MNIAHAQAAQYGVDGGRQELKTWLSRERRRVGANRLPCTGLNPTRSAYFDSDGCKKVRNEFPSLHLVQTYITLDYISLASLNFSSLFLLCL